MMKDSESGNNGNSRFLPAIMSGCSMESTRPRLIFLLGKTTNGMC